MVKHFKFEGIVAVESKDGGKVRVNRKLLSDYLATAITLYINTEENGELSNEDNVVGISLDWDSLRPEE